MRTHYLERTQNTHARDTLLRKHRALNYIIFYLSWVSFSIDADLLGNLDAVRLLDQTRLLLLLLFIIIVMIIMIIIIIIIICYYCLVLLEAGKFEQALKILNENTSTILDKVNKEK